MAAMMSIRMDALKSLIDAAKNTLYELIAVLLPGLIVLAAGEVLVQGPSISTVSLAYSNKVILVAAAYLVGLGLQGLSEWLCKRTIDRFVDRTAAQHLASVALGVATARFGKTITDSDLIDVALSRIADKRQPYDKFLALRDAMRGLSLAVPVLVACILFSTLAHRWAYAVLLSFVELGLIGRYVKFYPYAKQVAYGAFIAADGALPVSPAPPAPAPIPVPPPTTPK